MKTIRVPAAALASLLMVLAGPGDASQASPRHPFLFLTSADLARARRSVKADRTFARLAHELARRGATNRLEDLPPLERQWWETARAKPWRETYPEVFHHTLTVPMKWAALARDCAQAWLLAPAPELAAKARQILVGLADYTFEFEHYDVGLNYTIWAAAALEAYDILYEQCNAAERERLDDCFQRFLDAVSKNDDYWVKHEPGGKLNNHYAWHKLGLAMIGLFYQRPQLVREALRGPKGIHFMLQHGFKDDGLWLEGSIPYQFAATTPMLFLAELLENAGHPESVFKLETAGGRTLRQSYDALIGLLFPDRTLPAIGDCYARRPELGEHPDWENLHRRFGDARYGWLLAGLRTRLPPALFNGVTRLPNSPPPTQASRLWPEMGYLALRSNEGANYWSGQGWTVFATYSSQPVHENADKLSIQVFADGHLWLPDCEAASSAEHAFSSKVQGELNRQTLCHNTLLVDGRSQRFPGRRLDLVEYHGLPSVKRASLGDLAGQLYPGVRQLRSLVVRPEYVLDVFQAQCGEPRELAWLMHVDGASVAGSVKETKPVQFLKEAPWLYLRDGKMAIDGGRYWECFRHAKAASLLRVDVATSGPAEVFCAGFPRDDSPHPETFPMRLLQQRSRGAFWAAVYHRVQRPEQAVELSALPGELQTLEVSLKIEGREFNHVVPRLGEGSP